MTSLGVPEALVTSLGARYALVRLLGVSEALVTPLGAPDALAAFARRTRGVPGFAPGHERALGSARCRRATRSVAAGAERSSGERRIATIIHAMDRGKEMFALRLVVGTLLRVAVYGLLLFLPAWTIHWWRGWVLLGVVFAAMIAGRLWVFSDDNGLLRERRMAPIQRGQPVADKVLVVLFVLVMPAYIAFIPVDVFRLHLLPASGWRASALGLAAFVAGYGLIALALRENAFAAAIVKHQAERGQVVVESGIYSVIRHPFYSGVALLLIGAALWLESYAAAIAAIVPLALIVARLLVEERFLAAQLAGYRAYAQRVKHRLIPGVW